MTIVKPRPSHAAVDEIRELVERYSAHRDFYTSPSKNYNEHSCRDEFINAFLEVLGWDVANKKGVAPQFREVIAENYSSETERPDYTLTISGTPCFFVEAKKPSVDIVKEDSPSLQARKYGWNANHSIVLLTNFEDLIIFDSTVMPKPGDTPSTARYRRYNHCEYVQKFDEIYALISRESAYSGYFDNIVSRDFAADRTGHERVDSVFLEQINAWRLLIASSLLKSSERFRNEELLNDAVQDFINQLIFLRICEDRNLPVYHKLCELDCKDAEASILELLKAADKRYNSGLFAQTSAIAYIDNSVLMSIVGALYYPQSPYLFDIIDSSIFGQIYEMFLSEHLVVKPNGEPDLAKKREYKDRSVVATPVSIARYIVGKALSPICSGKNPSEILQIRCADISCGSGIFLIEAFEFLCSHCLSWLYEHKRDALIPMDSGRYKLPIELKKQILTSCLYGVDIDAHAVEVAKFSLLIKLIEEETAPTVESARPILPNLDDNIVVGNALVTPSEARRVHANGQDYVEMAPLDWCFVNGGARFDAIFGNPPYVKTEDMHRLSSDAEFSVYKLFYNSAYKQFDKYYLFIERSLKLLVDGGQLCLIVPNKFFKIASGSKLREMISRGGYLLSLDDFGDAQLFEDKTIYSSILCLRNDKQDSFTYRSVGGISELWIDEPTNTVSMNEASLGASPWKLTTDIEFLKKLQAVERVSVPLTNFVIPFNGIQTSAERNRTYWFLTNEIVGETESTYSFSRDGHEWQIEKDILRPFFKPTEEHGFSTYSPLVCDKWIIFPYDREGKLIAIDSMQQLYPGAWSYLLSRKNELWPKNLPGNGTRSVNDATEDTWYRYGRSQALSSFNGQEKIIVGVLSEQPLYYIDRNDWVIASGGTAGYCGIRLKNDCPYALEYIQAWLTNGNTEKIFAMIGSDFENGYKSRGTSLLTTLPFIELDFNDRAQKKIYNEVVNLSKRVQRINSDLLDSPSHREEAVLLREKRDAIKRISSYIDDVYALKDIQ